VPVEEDDVPPESIGSLLKCGLGYFLCFDCIGLFLPKFYISWFNEDPFTPVQEMEEFEVEPTMIPFGPYLALGAIVATIFQGPLLGLWQSYMNTMRGGPSFLEQTRIFGGLF
jgi:leader peptidase (prepilin peptidase)/N-methyltransferase